MATMLHLDHCCAHHARACLFVGCFQRRGWKFQTAAAKLVGFSVLLSLGLGFWGNWLVVTSLTGSNSEIGAASALQGLDRSAWSRVMVRSRF